MRLGRGWIFIHLKCECWLAKSHNTSTQSTNSEKALYRLDIRLSQSIKLPSSSEDFTYGFPSHRLNEPPHQLSKTPHSNGMYRGRSAKVKARETRIHMVSHYSHLIREALTLSLRGTQSQRQVVQSEISEI